LKRKLRRHAKEKTMSLRAYKVVENSLHDLPMMLLRMVHKLANLIDTVREFRTSDKKILKGVDDRAI